MPSKDLFSSESIYSIRRLNELLKSRILWTDDGLIYKPSVLTEVLIHLKDLMAKANTRGRRINFTDDIKLHDGLKINDITDLISNFRDVYCHINSSRKFKVKIAYSFIEIRGRRVYSLDKSIKSDYDDDIAYILGPCILYLKRHIERSFEEIKDVFNDLIGANALEFALRKNNGR